MKVPFCAIFVFFLKVHLINSKHFSARIINGKPAQVGQFPWFVSLKFPDNSSCGGTLISSKWVLTAAHCINSNQVTCYFGSLKKWHGLRIVSKNIIIHPNYVNNNCNIQENDVALIELSFRIYFNDTIRLIRLAKKWMTNKYFLNRSMTLAGTGYSKVNENRPRLRYTRMRVIPPQLCGLDTIDPPQDKICTRLVHEYSGKILCAGDLGSGLLYRYRSKSYLIGVASYVSLKCGDIHKTTVFQSVQMHLDWIKCTLGVFQFPHKK